MLWILLETALAQATFQIGPEGDFPTLGAAAASSDVPDGSILHLGAVSVVEQLLLSGDRRLIVEGEGVDATALSGQGFVLFGVSGNADLTVRNLSVALPGAMVPVLGEGGGDTRLTLENCAITPGSGTEFPGGAVNFRDGTLTIRNTTFSANTVDFPSGGHIVAIDSTVLIEGSTFTGGRADVGGSIEVGGTSLTIRDSAFRDNQASLGAAIRVYGGELVLEDSTFAANRSDADGSVDYGILTFEPDEDDPEDGRVTIRRSTFRNNTATNGASVALFGSATATIEDSTFDGNTSAVQAAGVYHHFGELSLLRNTFLENTGRIVVNAAGGDVLFGGNVFCGNATGQGAVLLSGDFRALTAQLHGNMFLSNEGMAAAADLTIFPGAPGRPVVGELVNNHLIGAQGAPSLDVTGQLTVTNNLFGATATAADGDLDGSHNAAYNVVEPPPTAETLALSGDASGGWGGSCDTLPLPDSALFDVGDPGITDGDGSRSDIGAFGGPGQAWWDLDGDGLTADVDCNDLQEGPCVPKGLPYRAICQIGPTALGGGLPMTGGLLLASLVALRRRQER